MNDFDPIRRRLLVTLWAGPALGTTAYIASVSVAPLVVEDMTGSTMLSGMPSTAAILGAALGAWLLTRRVAERGRRPGLLTGYALGVLGALTALAAVQIRSLTALLVGVLVLGIGHSSNQLSRYAAADLVPPHRRGRILGLIVWAGTVGAILGPALLQPSGGLATALGQRELAGPYALAAMFMAAAFCALFFGLRPDPVTFAAAQANEEALSENAERAVHAASAWRRPAVRAALIAMVTGQVVMVLIMTSTPLHVRHGGAGLAGIGIVMSAHTVGMFAFSPLTGLLIERLGQRRILWFGFTLLFAAAALAGSGVHGVGWLAVALWLLGLGWNMAFVGGSSLLASNLEFSQRAAIQGRVDSTVWLASAVASASSGFLFHGVGYAVLSSISIALLVLATVALLTAMRPLRPSVLEPG